ncbi:MAG: hypothetical protein LC774_15090 [Acidobacteria bacterium]|nr:hypothetical protein [Acidobacteriota bacterium]
MPHAGLRILALCAALACLASAGFAQHQPREPSADATRPKDEALRAELLKMLEADQALRGRMVGANAEDQNFLREMQAFDAANAKRLAQIFKTHGFPGVKLVGADGTQAVVTLLLHTPSLELQKKALPHVKRAARRGELPGEAFAMLTDDALAHEGRPQLYGTNFDLVRGKLVLAKTKDPARLDARLTNTPDGAFEAFTVEQPLRKTQAGTSVKDRIFFAQRKTGRVYEILGLPEGHRPFRYLRWDGNRVFIFDRWASPHHGIRYKLDVSRRKLISAKAFIEADYVELLKKAPR